MKTFALRDWIAGDIYDEHFDNKEYAFEEMEKQWNRLTKYDQNRRGFFGVIYGEKDKNGFIGDYDIIAYKKMKFKKERVLL